jgi:hypothetical protein
LCTDDWPLRSADSNATDEGSKYYGPSRKNYGILLAADIAKMKKIRHSSRKRPNRNFAIAAAPAAIPVNPKSAATIAIIKKIMAQRNIVSPPQNGIESSHRYARAYFA